jgi:2-polyprenyl-6-methoxyphenol hydroxylase-like FAD-dependent oxidoreductase
MTRVLIIGGGIGGLAAAIAARQAGCAVALFERAPELLEVGAGLTLWSNALRALRRLGVEPALTAVSTTLDRSEIRSWRGRLLTRTSLGALGQRLGAPTLATHRADLQSTLAAALEPGVVHLGAGYSGFTQHAEGVTARFDGGREERGDLLIGADGLRSTVRAQMLGPEPPCYSGTTAWRGVARFEHQGYPPGMTCLFIGRGSQVGLLPIGKGRTYWFATAKLPEGRADVPDHRKADLLARFQSWHETIPAVLEATEETGILRNDLYDRPPVRRWGEGRVTLLGDAAHPTTPNLGQGACLAIEDAVVLGRCLREQADPVQALRTYEQLRFDRTAAIVTESRRLGRLLEWSNPLACWLRDWLIRLTPARRGDRQLLKHLDYDPG